MAKQSLDTLKSYFSSGKYPNQSNYEDLIDTLSESSGGTEYTAGTNISIDNNVISATDTTYTASDFDLKDLSDSLDLKNIWSSKQDELTPGTNISIDNGIISATDTTYTASDFDIKDLTDSTNLKSTWNNKQDRLTSGTNITIENNVISATGGDGLKQVDLTTYADGVEGEIVQHIGSTTEDYIHGYIYKLSPGHVDRYEDVTIPAGSKKITYTNKFDQSQKVVYAIESVTLPESVVINFIQSGIVVEVSDEFINILHNGDYNQFISNNNLINESTEGLLYSQDDTLYKLIDESADISLNSIRSLYNYIKSTELLEGFRFTLSTECISGRITDLVASITFPMAQYNYNKVKVSESTTVRNLLISEVDALNWDVLELARSYNVNTEIVPGGKSLDFDRLNETTIIPLYNVFESDSTGIKYLTDYTGANAQSTSQMYETISSDGSDNRYIDINHNLCVFNSKPVSNGNYWANNVDIKLYFDYTSSIQDTTESITIHRKIQEYNEYGLPIDSMGLAWNRIDVQPANQLTAGDGITIEDNVISATGGQSTSDAELDPISENPVQNKTLYDELRVTDYEVQNVLPIDGVNYQIVELDADTFDTIVSGNNTLTLLPQMEIMSNGSKAYYIKNTGNKVFVSTTQEYENENGFLLKFEGSSYGFYTINGNVRSLGNYGYWISLSFPYSSQVSGTTIFVNSSSPSSDLNHIYGMWIPYPYRSSTEVTSSLKDKVSRIDSELTPITIVMGFNTTSGEYILNMSEEDISNIILKLKNNPFLHVEIIELSANEGLSYYDDRLVRRYTSHESGWYRDDDEDYGFINYSKIRRDSDKVYIEDVSIYLYSGNTYNIYIEDSLTKTSDLWTSVTD